MLSCDVSAAFDPMYESVYEKENTAYFGRGIIFNKYTGSRGKSGSNDANAEYIAHLRNILEKNQIVFQTAELGKVGCGGRRYYCVYSGCVWNGSDRLWSGSVEYACSMGNCK